MNHSAQSPQHLTELYWRGIILVLSVSVILLSVWCLSQGVTTIFMHLYYFPIVLLAYRYRWKGCGLATLLALVYIGLVIVFANGDTEVIVGGFYRFVVFVGIAAVIAYLSENLYQARISRQQSTELREKYLSLAPAIVLALNRNGAITFLNKKGGEILECLPDEVIGEPWAEKFLPEKDRERVKHVFSRIMAGNIEQNRIFENPVITSAGAEKIIRWNNTVLHDETGAITGTLGFGEDITEEKWAQNALFEMQQFQENVIANANVWISVLDMDGTLLVWNDAAEAISGYKKSDVLGKNTIWKKLYPDRDYRKKVTSDIRGIIGRDTYLEDFETEIRCSDGTKKTIVWNTRGMRDNSGALTSYIAIGRDITAQKSAEFRAGESARFLATMIDTLPMPIFFKDADGKYLGCNPPFEEYIGIRRDNLIGKTVYDISPKDLADVYSAADREIFQNPVSQRYDTQVQYADGSRHDVIFYKAPFFNKDGSVGGLIGAFLDITERKRMEEALRESESFNRGLVENLPEYLCVYGLDGRILYVNPASAKALGYEAETLTGTHVLSYVAEEYRDSVTEKIAARIAGDNSSYEIELVSKDGQRRSVIVKAIQIQYRNSPAVLLLLIDITERKRMESQLSLQNSQMSLAQQMAKIGYWSYDIATGIPLWSDVMFAVFGQDPKKGVPHYDQHREFIHPDDWATFDAAVRGASAGIPYNVEVRAIFPDGTLHYARTQGFPRYGPDNTIRELFGISQDITDQKQSQEALQKSEEKFRAFFSTSRDCVFITTLDGRWEDFNDAAVDLFGYDSRDDLLNVKVSDIYAHPDERDAHIRFILESGYSFEYPADLKKKDGTIINALVTTVVRKDPFGAIIGFQGSIRDVTEWKKTDRLLIEKQMQLSAAMDLAHMANWEFDVLTGIFTFNDRFYAMYGTTAEREGGYTMPADVYAREFVHPDDADYVAIEIKKAIETSDPLFTSQVEHRIIRRDGAIRDIIVRHAVVKDARGKTIRTHGANQDITDRKEVETALALERQRMESLLALSQMSQKADNEIISEVVEDAIRLTGSTIGYLATMNDDESVMTMQYWSISAHASCNIIDKPIVYAVEKTGLWGEAVRQRTSVITNDYAADSPFKRGTPQGHVPLVRHMNIPIFDGDHIVAVAGVGNKGTDYNEGDVRQLQLLMQGWWQIVVRKRAEEALRNSEGRLRTLLQTIPDLIWLKDTEGNYLSCNTMFERFFGAKEADIVGKTDYDFVEPKLADFFRENDRRAMAASGPTSNEEWITFADDGHRALLDTIKTPVVDARGKLIGVMGIGRDITGRNLMEEQLRESRQLFADIISFLPDPTFVIDKDGIVLAWNHALEQLSGVPAKDIIGKGNYEYSIWLYGKRRPVLIDLVLNQDLDAARLNYTDIHWEGRTVTAQTEFIPSITGHKTPLSLVASPLLDSQGNTTGAIESMRDISHVKEAEAALARLNANLETIVRQRTRALEEEVSQRILAEKNVKAALDYTRSVIEANPDLVVVLDEKGIILDVNTAGELLTGLPKSQLINTPYFGYLADDGTHVKKFTGLLQNGSLENIVEIRRTDGHLTPLSVHATVIKGPVGEKDQIIVAAHDITRQKRDEVAIQASLDEKVLLLREVHHRVKNNLQIIISLVNLQMRQTDDPEVKLIMSETQNRVRAMSLVHEKLYRSESLSRIDFSDYTRFLATQLFSFYGVDTRRVGLDIAMGKIMVDINTAVPLGLLMNELISNALKHAFPQGRNGTIRISGSYEAGLVTLVVQDDGVGVPADLDWKNTTSLGMRLITSLIDQVDGEIVLEREKGTAFTVTIPLKQEPAGKE